MKRIAVALMLALMPACSMNHTVKKADAPSAAGAETYFGVLPCPLECKDVRTELTLFANHKFSMEETFRTMQDPDKTEQSWGEWALVAGRGTKAPAKIYELTSDQFEQERYFLRVSNDVLRALDEEGAELLTKENVTLKRIKNL
jgi:hypothetical protein